MGIPHLEQPLPALQRKDEMMEIVEILDEAALKFIDKVIGTIHDKEE